MDAKKLLSVLAISFAIIFLYAQQAPAGEIDILVKKLVEKKILTEDEAKGILEETRQEAAKEAAGAASSSAKSEEKVLKESPKEKTSALPEWAQKINIKGDVRFRTQGDWGKGLNPAHSEIRERVRARLGVEGKVNDEVSGGVRFATGGSADPRSTNITLGNGNGDFSKTNVMFDQYYIKLEPHYQYLNGSKLWLGKFPLPFDSNEFLWDTDINPEGIGIQYVSPALNAEGFPETTIYANGGMLWLQELRNADTDPMMWAAQFGFLSKLIPDHGTKFSASAAYYDITREKNRNWTQNSAGTNSLQTIGDAGNNAAYIGTLKYDYNMLDLIVRLDNKKIFDVELPEHGLYGEFLHNMDPDSGSTGYLLGAYMGEKNIKQFGQWYLWFEWRYLGRDCAPDILPDSDFYGFSPSGVPGGGGTNAKGFNTGIQFGLLKNTYLNLELNWSEPIKSTNSTNESYQVAQADINVKF